MTRPRSSLLIAVLAIAFLGASALWAARPWFLEAWYLRKLGSSDRAVRVAAAERLSRLRSERSVAPIFDQLVAEGRASGGRVPESGSKVADGWFVFGPFWDALISLDGAAAPHLAGVLATSPDPFERSCAIYTLVNLSREVRAGLAATYFRALSDVEADVRVCGTLGLCDLSEDGVPLAWPEDARETLLRMATSESEMPETRANAAFLLGTLAPGSERCREALLRLREDADEGVRNQAAKALKGLTEEAGSEDSDRR